MTTKYGFEVGKAACVEFEPTLKEAFASVTTTTETPKTGDIQLVLIPKFVDVGSTMGVTAFSNRELDVILQWTVKDLSGTTIWIGTVQGSAKHHQGNIFTYKKNLKLIVDDAVKDLASQSAIKMSSSAELRKLSANVKPRLLRPIRSVPDSGAAAPPRQGKRRRPEANPQPWTTQETTYGEVRHRVGVSGTYPAMSRQPWARRRSIVTQPVQRNATCGRQSARLQQSLAAARLPIEMRHGAAIRRRAAASNKLARARAHAP